MIAFVALPMSTATDAPLPNLDARFALRNEAIEAFRRDGHVCLRGVAAPEEIEVFSPLIQRCALAHSLERRALEERDRYGRAFLQMINLWLVDAQVQAFVFSRRFAALAAELLGVKSVRLYHDQALFKEAGGGFTPWHQDQYYWPIDTEDTITLWMPLETVPVEVGGMHFVSGSQREGHLGDYAIGDESQAVFDAWIKEKGRTVASVGAMAAGDATFHHGWVVHGAAANQSDRLRPAMTMIYFRDGARVAPLDHPARRFDAAMYLPDCAEGEAAAGAFCPRLHPREAGPLPAPPAQDDAYRKRIFAALAETRAQREPSAD